MGRVAGEALGGYLSILSCVKCAQSQIKGKPDFKKKQAQALQALSGLSHTEIIIVRGRAWQSGMFNFHNLSGGSEVGPC